MEQQYPTWKKQSDKQVRLNQALCYGIPALLFIALGLAGTVL